MKVPLTKVDKLMNVFFLGSEERPLERLKPHVEGQLQQKLNPTPLEEWLCKPLPHESLEEQVRILRAMWRAIIEGDGERAFMLMMEYHNADYTAVVTFDPADYPEVVFTHELFECQ